MIYKFSKLIEKSMRNIRGLFYRHCVINSCMPSSANMSWLKQILFLRDVVLVDRVNVDLQKVKAIVN